MWKIVFFILKKMEQLRLKQWETLKQEPGKEKEENH